MNNFDPRSQYERDLANYNHGKNRTRDVFTDIHSLEYRKGERDRAAGEAFRKRIVSGFSVPQAEASTFQISMAGGGDASLAFFAWIWKLMVGCVTGLVVLGLTAGQPSILPWLRSSFTAVAGLVAPPQQVALYADWTRFGAGALLGLLIAKPLAFLLAVVFRVIAVVFLVALALGVIAIIGAVIYGAVTAAGSH